MRIAADVLARYIDVPADPTDLRSLLDDMGLEVKRTETEEDGTPVYTLELLANRGDHHCYEGVATELNGRLGVGVRTPEVTTLQVGESPWPLRCETDGCLAYSATLMHRSGGGSLGEDALRVLQAAGIHSLTPPVDASNLANLELGQPTHAFDADCIEGPITIRRTVEGEDCLPLFADKRVTLPQGTIVIADDAKILAVAGVIGCEESKTTEQTTRLLIESAAFDPVSVRKASRALDIHTDSSARFERGSDPARTLVGAGRMVTLLQTAGWTLQGETGLVGDWVDPQRTLSLSATAATAFLGVSLDAARCAELLQRFGFHATVDGDEVSVRVPTHRLWDVEFVQDLYEELAKAIGYNNTPSTLPPVDLGAVPAPHEQRKRVAEEVLLGHGFYEVFTDGFYGKRQRDLLGIDEGHPLWSHLTTLNALDRGYGLLKNNCLSQAIEAVAMNARNRSGDVRLYEWTRTFHPTGAPADRHTSPCTERKLLWAVAAGTDRPRTWDDRSRPADPWFFKGLVDELATALQITLEVGVADPSQPLADRLHPGRQASITLDGAVVGLLGEIHPALCKAAKLKKIRPVYLEIDQAALTDSSPRRPVFVEPPDWQPIVRSLAFAVPGGTEAATVTRQLEDSGPDWLLDVRITDRFDSDDVRSLTWQLSFANDPADRRSAESVNAACEAMANAVLERVPGVTQR